MKKLLIKILLIFYPLIKKLPDTNLLKEFKFKLYLASLLQKGDFLSEHEYRIALARKQGVKIGKNCRITGGVTFNSEPYLVEIGDNVIIAGEVKFITHDGGVNIFNFTEEGKNILGSYGKIKIGNNCFIGMRAMIMPGVSIGNNCIIGAGSVVMDSFPDNCVIMGNPAKVVYRTELYKKLKFNYPGTIFNKIYHFPFEESFDPRIKREIIKNTVKDLPFKRIKRTK